jgi:O-antigen/teichoic acid export membrane protein
MSEFKAGRTRGAMTNAAWNAFSTLWSIVISFVVAPLLIHNMGTDHYGILLLFWSVTGILGLMGFGFGEATLRYMAHYFGEGSLSGVNRVMGATLSFYLVVCVVVCGGLFVAAPAVSGLFNIAPEDRHLMGWLVRLAAVVFALRAVTLTYAAVPMALHRYDISSKINVIQNVVRSGGYILLAVLGFGLLHLVIWDVLTQFGTLCVQAGVVRRLSPGLRLTPSLSFRGLREILGFSVFSFLTYLFFTVHREAAKVLLGNQFGPTQVAYFGTPDNVAQRIQVVVSSGSETLMPRFSANRDVTRARTLFKNGTWASLVVSLVLFLPLVVLMPDFLRLWISPEFALESAAIGQLVALSYIFQGAYAPAATYFRGIGRPWLVTVIMILAALVTILFSVLLMPVYGVMGVGYAYLLGSLPSLLGLVHCWIHLFGRSSATGLLRAVALPVLMTGIAFALEHKVRGYFGPLTWFDLFALGGSYVVLTGILVVGADWILGGADATSKEFLAKVRASEKLNAISKLVPFRRVR